MSLRVTRPCGRCHYDAEHAPFLGSLRMLVATAERAATHPLPEVVVDCRLYLPASRRAHGDEDLLRDRHADGRG